MLTTMAASKCGKTNPLKLVPSMGMPRHEYHAEKKFALEMLAAQIERILDPQDNVVALRP